MPGPSDFLVGNAPGGVPFAPPRLDFSQIANLPNDYYYGQQQARQLQLQRMFANGFPTIKSGPNAGQPDPLAIQEQLARVGGPEYAQNLVNFLQKQNMAKAEADAADPDAAGSQPPVNTSPTSSPTNASPENIVGSRAAPATSAPQSSTQPRANDTNSILPDSEQFITPQTLADRAYGKGTPAAKNAAAGAAKRLGNGVTADTPLDDKQTRQIIDEFGRQPNGPKLSFNDRFQGGDNNNEDPAASGPGARDTSPTDKAMNGPNAAPFMAGGASGAGAPPQSPGGLGVEGESPAGPQRGASVPQPNPSLAQVAIPPAVQAQVSKLDRQIANATRAAIYARNQGSDPKDLDARIKGWQDDRARLLDPYKPTPEMVQAASEGRTPSEAAAHKDVLAKRIDASQKQYEGTKGQSDQYEQDLKPMLNVAKGILNDPTMYTGFGANATLDFNRVRAAFGDQKAAQLQETLGKINAKMVLSQINQQRNQMIAVGSNSARLFSAQVSQVEKTSAQLPTTLAGNRTLVEITDRMGKFSQFVTGKMQDWLSTHDYFTPEFDRQLSKDIENYHIFSTDELAHPDLLGAPTVPPGLRGAMNIKGWATHLGLKTDDAIRGQDGRIYHVP